MKNRVLQYLGRHFRILPEWGRAVLLFAMSLITSTMIGAYYFAAGPLENWRDFLQGLNFSLPLLLILSAHEMGHYLMCRRHNIRATPPYFIPFPPFPFLLIPGTLGAFIKIKEPIPHRSALLEMGAAGPLAGLLVAVPIYAAGVLTSPVTPLDTGPGVLFFGEPIITKLIHYLFLPYHAAKTDVMLNSFAFAGWFGILVTLINLIPVGQLDGGHICYALFGKKQETIARVVTIFLLCLVFFWPGWVIWVIFTRFLTGLKHPPTLFDFAPLTKSQKYIGYASIIILVLIFMPAPISVPEWGEDLGLLFSFLHNMIISLLHFR